MTNLPFNGKFRVTCEYKRKGSWQAGFHTGIDLVGDSDKTVYSICDGKVIMAKYYGDYGNAVKVKDSNTGKIFLFAHLKSFAVKVGQTVSRVSKLGIMGNTGRSSGAHLHLEMRTSADKYGVVEDIASYMGLPNKVGSYNSTDFQITEKPDIRYEVHVENIGWQGEKENGELAGTEGQALRIEAVKIHADIPIQYRVHMADKGWGEYVSNSCMAGTVGESRRIEAIEITSSKNKIKATAHIEGIGNAYYEESTHLIIGTEGRALRLEALRLEFV